MSVLRRIWGAVTHNFWWRILALAAAVAIWALVASEPELSLFVTVPLEYRNLPENLEINSAPPETVTLELRGPSGELRGVGDGRSPSVVLDMSSVTPGLHTFNIRDGNVRLARGVRLVRATPSEVRVDLEQQLVRTVPVHVRFAGDPAAAIAHYDVTPDRLSIVGPNRRVEQIASVATDPVDVSAAAKGTIAFRVNALVDDPFVRFPSSSAVTVTVTLKSK